MDDFGLRDQYEPNMLNSYIGIPESLMRLHQYDIPAQGTCINKDPYLRMFPDEENQRLAPIRKKSLEYRVDELEKQSPCKSGLLPWPREKGVKCKEKFEGGESLLPSSITLSSEMILIIFIFIIFIFIILHFNNAINEIKDLLRK